MQVGLGEVDLQNRSSCGDLVHVEWNGLRQDVQGGPNPVTGDAAAQRVQPLDQCVHLSAERGLIGHGRRKVSATELGPAPNGPLPAASIELLTSARCITALK
jgi:hypothetical protein